MKSFVIAIFIILLNSPLRADYLEVFSEGGGFAHKGLFGFTVSMTPGQGFHSGTGFIAMDPRSETLGSEYAVLYYPVHSNDKKW